MSGWKEGAAKRRDARHTRGPDDVGKRPAAKKDTKRWCRGKVGVEHKTAVHNYRDLKRAYVGFSDRMLKGWLVLHCTECGKELDTWWPSGFNKRNPPEWVVRHREGK